MAWVKRYVSIICKHINTPVTQHMTASSYKHTITRTSHIPSRKGVIAASGAAISSVKSERQRRTAAKNIMAARHKANESELCMAEVKRKRVIKQNGREKMYDKGKGTIKIMMSQHFELE